MRRNNSTGYSTKPAKSAQTSLYKRHLNYAWHQEDDFYRKSKR